jgi:hypothetical protein
VYKIPKVGAGLLYSSQIREFQPLSVPNLIVSLGSSKGDVATAVDAAEAIKALQICVQSTEAGMTRVEEASNYFGATQKKMDDQLDGICLMLAQLSDGSDFGSAQKQHPTTASPLPPPPTGLTQDGLAFLKKQEAQGKISILNTSLPNSTPYITYTTDTITLNTFERNHTSPQRFAYTHIPLDTSNT